MLRRLVGLLLIAIVGLCGNGATSAATNTSVAGAATFTYDARTNAHPSLSDCGFPRVGAHAFWADIGTPAQLHGRREESASLSIEVRGSSTTSHARSVATNLADDLVRFDPELASRRVAGQNGPGATGYATTPGGNTLSVHAVERTFLGGPGRTPMDPSLIDDIREQGTRTAYRGASDTVKVSAPNLCGKCYVVVDAQTGKHVVTVMVPK